MTHPPILLRHPQLAGREVWSWGPGQWKTVEDGGNEIIVTITGDEPWLPAGYKRCASCPNPIDDIHFILPSGVAVCFACHEEWFATQ